MDFFFVAQAQSRELYCLAAHFVSGKYQAEHVVFLLGSC